MLREVPLRTGSPSGVHSNSMPARISPSQSVENDGQLWATWRNISLFAKAAYLALRRYLAYGTGSTPGY